VPTSASLLATNATHPIGNDRLGQISYIWFFLIFSILLFWWHILA
jgi:hypothetical protein